MTEIDKLHDLDAAEWFKATSKQFDLVKNITLNKFKKPKSYLSSNASQDDGAPGTSGGVFLGDSNNETSGDDLYTNPSKLPGAVSSILNRVQNAAGFYPNSMSPDELGNRFWMYLLLLELTPYFTVSLIAENDVRTHSSDPNFLCNTMVSSMSGLDPSFTDYVKQSCYEMAGSIFSERTASGCMNLFNQSIMDFHDYNNAQMLLYYITLYMDHDSSGKHEVADQEETLFCYRLLVDRNAIVRDSDILLAQDRRDVNNWLGSNKSPSSGQPLCVDYQRYSSPGN
ncbi:hypothetical protein IPC444_20890 [Pseudomonas aeruginosa]|uniref:hypothetical protein n=1 Tax=Pseudomonas aeruginosa TaxID=287 RepID=UPI000F8698E5|nr:hypothetical protein [Pseudomonas aeruginosa]RUI00799.1 hypothetical protein IPC444_20890 [Pseudomonas aeruginosa]